MMTQRQMIGRPAHALVRPFRLSFTSESILAAGPGSFPSSPRWETCRRRRRLVARRAVRPTLPSLRCSASQRSPKPLCGAPSDDSRTAPFAPLTTRRKLQNARCFRIEKSRPNIVNSTNRIVLAILPWHCHEYFRRVWMCTRHVRSFDSDWTCGANVPTSDARSDDRKMAISGNPTGISKHPYTSVNWPLFSNGRNLVPSARKRCGIRPFRVRFLRPPSSALPRPPGSHAPRGNALRDAPRRPTTSDATPTREHAWKTLHPPSFE